jgi:UDP-N-acetylglucosamine 2-epimerase (non-hydrolysing)
MEPSAARREALGLEILETVWKCRPNAHTRWCHGYQGARRGLGSSSPEGRTTVTMDEDRAAAQPVDSATKHSRPGPWRHNGRVPRRQRVLAVVGTRPEVIKMFSPLRALGERESVFETYLCSSGQHGELLADALATFGLNVDYDLAAMRHDQHPADVAWMVTNWITNLCRRLRPDVVLVQGDTATTMAAGLATFYCSGMVAHVEAGLRTYDNRAPWPEEANRRIVGAIADLHFAPSKLAAANLLREGVEPDRVHVTGNTGIDALKWALSRSRARAAPPPGERRVMVTAHRRESLPDGVEAILRAVQRLACRYPDVRFQFMVHPAPAIDRALKASLQGDRPRNLELLEPCSYVPFVQRLAESFLILTDSGGLQEEAPVLGKPVLVINEQTERHEPLAAGTAHVIGTTEDDIVNATARLLDDPVHYAQMAIRHDPYGDGHAGERIADLLDLAFRREAAADAELAFS